MTIVLAITLGVGEEPAFWAYFAPLGQLALLILMGLHIFVVPHAGGRNHE